MPQHYSISNFHEVPNHHHDVQLVSSEEVDYNQQCQSYLPYGTQTFIDISFHIFDTIVHETITTSRPKLIFPSLLIRLFRAKGVDIPQDISIMPTPSAINKQTIIRIQICLPGDEEEGDQGEGDPMETETVVAGQTSTSRSRGKRSRTSTLSDVPPDAFQIILERIDGLREVQNKHTDRMATIQDQLNMLSAKFNSFSTQQ